MLVYSAQTQAKRSRRLGFRAPKTLIFLQATAVLSEAPECHKLFVVLSRKEFNAQLIKRGGWDIIETLCFDFRISEISEGC